MKLVSLQVVSHKSEEFQPHYQALLKLPCGSFAESRGINPTERALTYGLELIELLEAAAPPLHAAIHP